MYITKIELKNFKAIEEFEREFEGNVYLVTGENEIGKSTLLQAITILLTGDRSANLLKLGKEKGFAKATIKNESVEYEVEIRFTESNPRGTLTITTAEGMKSDNKSMIQKIFNYVDFDANEFVSWSATAEGKRKQVEVVKSLLPAKVTEELAQLEIDITATRESRKEVNAQFKANKAIIDKSQFTDDDVKKYKEEIDITELQNKRMSIGSLNLEIGEVLKRYDERQIDIDGFASITEQREETLEQDIKELQDELIEYSKQRKEELNILNEKQSKAKKHLKDNPVQSIDPIEEEIEKAQDHNNLHYQVKEFANVSQQLKKIEKERIEFNDKINKKEDRKAELMRSSKLPIDGLTFTEDGLFLDKIPFAPGEVSTSQEMEVAAKLIIAKNPTVKVFKIAQGESLGTEKLRAIVEFAKKNGYQGFIEEVKRGQQDLRIEEYTEA